MYLPLSNNALDFLFILFFSISFLLGYRSGLIKILLKTFFLSVGFTLVTYLQTKLQEVIVPILELFEINDIYICNRVTDFIFTASLFFMFIIFNFIHSFIWSILGLLFKPLPLPHFTKIISALLNVMLFSFGFYLFLKLLSNDYFTTMLDFDNNKINVIPYDKVFIILSAIGDYITLFFQTTLQELFL